MKTTSSIIAFFLFIQTSFAQTKMLTMEEAVLKQKNDLAPKRLSQLGWIPGTANYYYISGKKKDSLMIGNAEKGKANLKMTLVELNTLIGSKDTFQTFPVIKWIDKDRFEVGDQFKFAIQPGLNVFTRRTRMIGKDQNIDEFRPELEA